jgi:hypothetical protein
VLLHPLEGRLQFVAERAPKPPRLHRCVQRATASHRRSSVAGNTHTIRASTHSSPVDGAATTFASTAAASAATGAWARGTDIGTSTAVTAAAGAAAVAAAAAASDAASLTIATPAVRTRRDQQPKTRQHAADVDEEYGVEQALLLLRLLLLLLMLLLMPLLLLRLIVLLVGPSVREAAMSAAADVEEPVRSLPGNHLLDFGGAGCVCAEQPPVAFHTNTRAGQRGLQAQLQRVHSLVGVWQRRLLEMQQQLLLLRMRRVQQQVLLLLLLLLLLMLLLCVLLVVSLLLLVLQRLWLLLPR